MFRDMGRSTTKKGIIQQSHPRSQDLGAGPSIPNQETLFHAFQSLLSGVARECYQAIEYSDDLAVPKTGPVPEAWCQGTKRKHYIDRVWALLHWSRNAEMSLQMQKGPGLASTSPRFRECEAAPHCSLSPV